MKIDAIDLSMSSPNFGITGTFVYKYFGARPFYKIDSKGNSSKTVGTWINLHDNHIWIPQEFLK